jgi:hypothetical protein
MVGGSEANYLIGEMVSPENAGSGATYIRSVSRALLLWLLELLITP